MGSDQLLKKVSYKGCQGDVSVQCLATRKCSRIRGKASLSGSPKLMTLQLTKQHRWRCDRPSRKNTCLYKQKVVVILMAFV